MSPSQCKSVSSRTPAKAVARFARKPCSNSAAATSTSLGSFFVRIFRSSARSFVISIVRLAIEWRRGKNCTAVPVRRRNLDYCKHRQLPDKDFMHVFLFFGLRMRENPSRLRSFLPACKVPSLLGGQHIDLQIHRDQLQSGDIIVDFFWQRDDFRLHLAFVLH